MLSRREQARVETALAILREAYDVRRDPCRSLGVRLALLVLLPYVDKRSLRTFWVVTGNVANAGQRSMGLRRQFELIELAVLRRTSGIIGAWSEIDPPVARRRNDCSDRLDRPKWPLG